MIPTDYPKRQSAPKKITPSFVTPEGIPRGFLRLYLLRRISDKPAHGYDLMQEIRTKTHGAWSPGSGSTYPILKELVAQGLIIAEPSKKSGRQTQAYRITPEGSRFLKENTEKLAFAGRNFNAMRPILMELTEPDRIPTMFPNMVSSNLEFHRDLIESKREKLPREELRSLLKEYLTNLEKQIVWTKQQLRQK